MTVQVHQPIYNITPFRDVDENDTSSILSAADLNWSLVLKPCLYHNENNELTIGNKRYLLILRNKMLTEMTVVGRDYKCVQPASVIELFQKTNEHTPMNLISAGHTRDGKYIYIIGEIIGANKSTVEKSLSLNRCIMISVCNDGNGKLKVTPIMLSKTGSQLRLVQGEKAKPLVYELSHHFDFDGEEILYSIRESVFEMFNAFSDEIEYLNSIPITKIIIDEFCHQIFKRFNIGNEKTRRNYEKTFNELKEHYNLLSIYQPKEIQDTMFSLYLFFCDYLDFSKTRKSGINGRIHSVNFGHDSVSKKEAFRLIYKLAKDA